MTWLRWYVAHVRHVSRAVALYLRDGDELALDLRIGVSQERDTARRAVKAASLAMHLIGGVFLSLTPALKRTVEAMARFREAA